MYVRLSVSCETEKGCSERNSPQLARQTTAATKNPRTNLPAAACHCCCCCHAAMPCRTPHNSPHDAVRSAVQCCSAAAVFTGLYRSLLCSLCCCTDAASLREPCRSAAAPQGGDSRLALRSAPVTGTGRGPGGTWDSGAQGTVGRAAGRAGLAARSIRTHGAADVRSPGPWSGPSPAWCC
jgi:hypothetical protein